MLTYIKPTPSSNCDKCTHIMDEPGRLNGARTEIGAVMGRGS